MESLKNRSEVTWVFWEDHRSSSQEIDFCINVAVIGVLAKTWPVDAGIFLMVVGFGDPEERQGWEHFSDDGVCWLVLCDLDTIRVFWEKRTLVEKMPPPDCPIGKHVRHLLDWWIDEGGPRLLWAVPSLNCWSWVLEESRLSKLWGASQ